MKEIFVDADFDVEEITSKINNLMYELLDLKKHYLPLYN